MGVLFSWWAWFAAALVLGILEILAPAFVLLGFAIGAAVVALLLFAAPATMIGIGMSWLLVIFALASLGAWLILRKVFSLRTGQVKIWEEDING